MLRKLYVIVCGAVLACTYAHAEGPLRLMTYNIRNANGMDDVCDYQRIANIINVAAPDVVAVQETDSMTRRSNEAYVLGEIAASTGMNAYFAPAIDYDGGKYGIGILARQKPLRVTTVALPGREEPRAMAVAEFDDYVFACTHLSLTEADRMASLDIIRGIALRYDKPFFLAGDMNAEPDEAFIQAILKDFDMLSNPALHTYPSPAPEQTIDYIFVFKPTAGSFIISNSEVLPDTVASDHRPVTVDILVGE